MKNRRLETPNTIRLALASKRMPMKDIARKIGFTGQTGRKTNPTDAFVVAIAEWVEERLNEIA